MGAAQRTAPRRERVRAATIQEIKEVALDLMREHGPAGVRFTDIAKVMEMTPPALYRYFADRDELLNALVADAYLDLGDEIQEAQQETAAGGVAGMWAASAHAYRNWARREPQRFALIFGLPVPGYVAPEEGPTTEAAKRALATLGAMFVEALRRGTLRPPMLREVDPAIVQCEIMKSKEKLFAERMPPESFQAMLHAWAALHGFVSLEAYGHFDWMDQPARDALFAGQIHLAARVAGLH